MRGKEGDCKEETLVSSLQYNKGFAVQNIFNQQRNYYDKKHYYDAINSIIDVLLTIEI